MWAIKLMQLVLKKKIIGTAVYSLILAVILVAIGSPVFAQFIQTRSTLIVDGVVVAVGSSSLTLDTAGSSAFDIDINSRTIFPSGLALAGISPGDVLSIVARNSGSGNPVARVIRKHEGSGYGFPGETVIVRRGEVVSKGATSFTVDSGIALITFDVIASTRFVRTNFSILALGDRVQITGRDSGTSFVARTVIKR